jgi:N-glycosylase/DNA lyase
MNTIKIDISTAPYFSLISTVLFHGWINLEPFYWDHEKQILYLSINTRENSYRGKIWEEKKDKKIIFESSKQIIKGEGKALKSAISWMLDLNLDIQSLENLCKLKEKEEYLKLIWDGWGRTLKSSTPWEDAVKTICTTNASWAYTKIMCRNLCSLLGVNECFPTPDSIYSAGIEFLKEKVKLGYRSKYIYKLSEDVLSMKIRLNNLKYGKCFESFAEDKIKKIKGLGPYGTNHLLVMLGWYSYLPIDREVMKFLKVKPLPSGKCPWKTLHYSEWRNYRFVIYKFDRILKRKNWIGD